MRIGRLPGSTALLVAVAGCVGLSAGCGDDVAGDPQESKAPATDDSDKGGEQGDACTLLDDDALEPLFPDGVPEPTGTSMGAGFAECEWGSESEGTLVLISTLPATDFQSDYVDQLDVTAPVTGIGDHAVSFPGFVGIGRGSSRGGSVGFVKGDHAALVAVRSSGQPAADAELASQLAGEAVAEL